MIQKAIDPWDHTVMMNDVPVNYDFNKVFNSSIMPYVASMDELEYKNDSNILFIDL